MLALGFTLPRFAIATVIRYSRLASELQFWRQEHAVLPPFSFQLSDARGVS
jgi:hypothetical protein